MNAVSATAVQLLAIFYLTPPEYGKFAVGYIFYAAGVSVVHAVVCDAWLRSMNRRIVSSWIQYSAALVSLVTILTVPIGVSLALLQIGPASIWITIAIFTNLCRLGARYHAVAKDEHRYVAPADALGLCATIAGFFVLHGLVDSFEAIAMSWAMGGVVALLASKRLVCGRRYLSDWVRTNASSIRILSADAALVDATAIGVPLLMSPLLGLTSFGIYRSLSSTAIPVRLVLNPLRPKVMSRPSNYFFERGRFISVLAVALMLGSCVWFALTIVATEELFSGGVLAALSLFALPAGIYVAANFVSTLFYISNRSHLANDVLIAVGTAQLVLAVGVPLSGFLLGGLPVLMYAFSLTAVLSAGINSSIAFRHVAAQAM